MMIMDLSTQVRDLFLMPLAIGCISWTVTHEEIFKEPRDFCVRKVHNAKKVFTRKFFYVFTCEYCFSHYITILFLFITQYHLIFSDWRGYLVGGFALVWISNFYMSIFGFIRVGMKKERIEANMIEKESKE